MQGLHESLLDSSWLAAGATFTINSALCPNLRCRSEPLSESCHFNLIPGCAIGVNCALSCAFVLPP